MAETSRESPRPCPVCRSLSGDDLGRIIHKQPVRVAGVELDLGGIEFRLRGCRSCGFQYKDPPIPQRQLLRCYEQASAEHWQENPNPRKRRFDAVKDIIESHCGGRRILDIGCFNGAMLQYLGDVWDRYGIEPSRQAATMARQRGVCILGSTIEELPWAIAPFDVVLAIDVIEHLNDPIAFFGRMRACLKPGGILVLGTGDTGSWTWRLQGSRYWYCSLPEHVGFYGQKTLCFIADSIGMQTLQHVRLSHVRSPVYRRIRQTIANLLYAGVTRLHGFGLPALQRRLARQGAPGWLTAGDHMLHVMQAM
ncbi:MAG: class I SAM-dependent methyltransferase [Planctomycetes bacterium]|nr:class I SAM-dependent methyltransferase [Planctomycetota bacterium]